jgi:hypothetical protein
MGFLKDQKLEIDDHENITLTNTFDTTELEQELYEERKVKQDGKSLRRVCSIPEFEFAVDPMLKRYQMYCEMGDAEEARKVLRDFLKLNPQYLATDKKF